MAALGKVRTINELSTISWLLDTPQGFRSGSGHEKIVDFHVNAPFVPEGEEAYLQLAVLHHKYRYGLIRSLPETAIQTGTVNKIKTNKTDNHLRLPRN
ncbi:MAG: hypothetical protein MRK01_11540 [Candidatus Scalindua sp.]|nr:hypothetical protein [Candidatus Scalindua sp.]